MQCVAVCCSILQSMQCGAGCILKDSAKTNLTKLEVCCSALQCVAVCCSLLQCDARCSLGGSAKTNMTKLEVKVHDAYL